MSSVITSGSASSVLSNLLSLQINTFTQQSLTPVQDVNHGDVTLTVVSNTPDATGKGMTFGNDPNSQVLTFHVADASNPGLVSSGTQTFQGAKTITDKLTVNQFQNQLQMGSGSAITTLNIPDPGFNGQIYTFRDVKSSCNFLPPILVTKTITANTSLTTTDSGSVIFISGQSTITLPALSANVAGTNFQFIVNGAVTGSGIIIQSAASLANIRGFIVHTRTAAPNPFVKAVTPAQSSLTLSTSINKGALLNFITNGTQWFVDITVGTLYSTSITGSPGIV